MNFTGYTPAVLKSLVLLSCLFSIQPALGRGERVLGSGEEGSSLRVAYVKKMEKIDSDKKQCRNDIKTVIAPELALLDELGQAGHAGPSLVVKEEAQMAAESERLVKLQTELVQLGKMLNQAGRKENAQSAKVLRQFEKQLKEYAQIEKSYNMRADSLAGKSEKLVSNFVPFAKAVLSIKKSKACEEIWADLRTSIPKNMEQTVVRNRDRIKQMIAANKSRSGTQHFSAVASKMLLRFKTRSQIAFEENGNE
jgi:hypothetical protein